MAAANHQIGDLMSPIVVDIEPSDSLREAARVLAEESVGALLVLDRRGAVGILTERDVVRAIGDGLDPDEERVLDHLTEDLLTTDRHTPVPEVIDLMTANEVRHIVVTERGAPCGIVSMRAITRDVRGDLQPT